MIKLQKLEGVAIGYGGSIDRQQSFPAAKPGPQAPHTANSMAMVHVETVFSIVAKSVS